MILSQAYTLDVRQLFCSGFSYESYQKKKILLVKKLNLNNLKLYTPINLAVMSHRIIYNFLRWPIFSMFNSMHRKLGPDGELDEAS